MSLLCLCPSLCVCLKFSEQRSGLVVMHGPLAISCQATSVPWKIEVNESRELRVPGCVALTIDLINQIPDKSLVELAHKTGACIFEPLLYSLMKVSSLHTIAHKPSES